MSSPEEFILPEEALLAVIKQHNEWGPIKIPVALQDLKGEQLEALKMVLEDRRVTDLSAHYWMKLRKINENAGHT